jgi:hypothetical protein
MATDKCLTCSTLSTSVREPYDSDEPFDPTQGLVQVEGNVYACPRCGQRYRYEVESATMFHDYHTHVFTRIEDDKQPS